MKKATPYFIQIFIIVDIPWTDQRSTYVDNLYKTDEKPYHYEDKTGWYDSDDNMVISIGYNYEQDPPTDLAHTINGKKLGHPSYTSTLEILLEKGAWLQEQLKKI